MVREPRLGPAVPPPALPANGKLASKIQCVSAEFAALLHVPQLELLPPSGPPGAPSAAPSGAHGHPDESLPGPPREEGPQLSELDPLAVSLALPGGWSSSLVPDPGSGAKPLPTPSAAELSLVDQVVRRVVWGGDRRRGVARIELDGELAGTTIWVRGEGRAVSLEIVAGPGLDGAAVSSRLADRLRARGLELTGVELR